MKRAEYLLLFIVVLVAFFLRAYRISENFLFFGETGNELLAIKNSILVGELPLVGPVTSHPWLYFGPGYYWLLIVLTKIFGFKPLLEAWVGVAVGTLAVLLNFIVIKKIFGKNVALVSTLIIAVSPIWIWFTRTAKLHIFLWMIFYLFLYLLWELWKGKTKNLFWLGVTWGSFFSFHFSPVLLLPVAALVFYLRRGILSFRHYLLGVLGVALANLPVILYDARQGFSMTTKFIVWIPYRILGFLGLYPKNNPTEESIVGSLKVTNEFFGKTFLGQENFWILGIVIFFTALIYLLKRTKKNIWSDFGLFFIVTSTIFTLLAVFIHGDMPLHYFLPFFPIPPLALALSIEKLWDKRMFFVIIGIFILVLNIKFFSSHFIFYGNVDKAITSQAFVPYKLQREIARYIVNDAQGERFRLRRVGPYDYFSEDYSQNYRYLLWYFGNEPSQEGKITYTIYEELQKLPLKADVKWFSNVAVVKEE